MEGDERWTADRAEALREDYMKALAAHRAAIEAITRRLGWSFAVHHTDRPAAEPLFNVTTSGETTPTKAVEPVLNVAAVVPSYARLLAMTPETVIALVVMLAVVDGAVSE